jgi:RNA polymerase sigma factor (sigma-70 family)
MRKLRNPPKPPPFRLLGNVTGSSQSEASGASPLAALFIEHNRSLCTFLRARVGTVQDAEDIAQEAYARLLQLGQSEAVGYLRTYLFKTAAHIAIDRARQLHSRSRLDEEVTVQQQFDEETPEQQVHAAEQLKLLRRVLGELPVKYRRAFLLHQFRDWTTAQIAADMKIRERMARRYLSRATQYCKRRLEGLSASAAHREIMCE